MCTSLNPKYIPPSRAKMEDVLIPAEAAHIRSKQLKYLRTQHNLTISYDGGSTRSQESFYTFHITSASRVSFFMQAYPGGGEVHNAQFIADATMKVNHHLIFLCLKAYI